MNVLIASDVLIKDNKSVYYKSFYESQMKNKNKQKYLAASKAGSELANKRNHLAKILAARQQATHRKKAILQALLVKVFAMDEILRRNKDQPDPKEKFVSFPFIMVSAAASEDNNVCLY